MIARRRWFSNETLAAPKLDRAVITWSIRVLPRRGDTLQLPFNDPNLDKEATTNGPEAQNEGQDIGEPGRLEREINDFLATLGPGAVLNTQTAIAAVRNENEQIETEYVVTVWYE